MCKIDEIKKNIEWFANNKEEFNRFNIEFTEENLIYFRFYDDYILFSKNIRNKNAKRVTKFWNNEIIEIFTKDMNSIFIFESVSHLDEDVCISLIEENPESLVIKTLNESKLILYIDILNKKIEKIKKEFYERKENNLKVFNWTFMEKMNRISTGNSEIEIIRSLLNNKKEILIENPDGFSEDFLHMNNKYYEIKPGVILLSSTYRITIVGTNDEIFFDDDDYIAYNLDIVKKLEVSK